MCARTHTPHRSRPRIPVFADEIYSVGIWDCYPTTIVFGGSKTVQYNDITQTTRCLSQDGNSSAFVYLKTIVVML